MFCPQCGIEDRNADQFCRACGGDLRRVRAAVALPDNITASAASARDEIGGAIATRIREIRSAEELSTVAEEVLPEIEKFLESPEEKRLRRMRAGMLLSSIGLGTAVGMAIVSAFMRDQDVIFLVSLGIIAFFFGLGFIMNGILLTVPKKSLSDRSSDAESQRRLDRVGNTNELELPPPSADIFSSVTENTTRHLEEKQPVKE
jgi:hypothetical protein